MEVYKKEGKRYKLIGEQWEGFPCDGIWQVRDGTKNNKVLLMRDEIAPLYATLYRTHIETLCNYLMEKQADANFRYSHLDMAKWACDYFAEVMERQLLKGGENEKKDDKRSNG